MKKLLCISLLLSGCGQHGQQTRLRVVTEGAQTDPMVVTEPATGQPVHRVLRNTDGRVLFAYDLEVNQTEPGQYRLLLKPSQQQPTLENARNITVVGNKSVRVVLPAQPVTGEMLADVFSVAPKTAVFSPMARLRQVHNHVFKMVHGE
jgi:hypothetical protein